jgi:hypothetical protein
LNVWLSLSMLLMVRGDEQKRRPDGPTSMVRPSGCRLPIVDVLDTTATQGSKLESGLSHYIVLH